MNQDALLQIIGTLATDPGQRFVPFEEADGLYVMWWPARGLSKVGVAGAPVSRLSQIRKEKGDGSIILAAAWRVLSTDWMTGVLAIEAQIHAILRAAGFEDRSNPYLSEWFEMPWPAAVHLVEQWEQLAAPLGIRLQRMQGAHG